MNKKSIKLEDVFKDSGVPEYNFVESQEYFNTLIALRTEGKGVVIEGPSGIGKTSCVMKILDTLDKKPMVLSALRNEDVECINLLIENPDGMGSIIIDDFHRLDEGTKNKLTDLLKIGADQSRKDFKLVLIGINQAGDSLVKLAPEINNRIETIKFENNPPEKVEELISKGEAVLNIEILDKDEIVRKACGSFHIAQMLCKAVCVQNRVDCAQINCLKLDTKCIDIVKRQIDILSRVHGHDVKIFARGNKPRKSGNHPYLRLLQFLHKEENGVICITDICIQHPELKASFDQITRQGYLASLIKRHPGLTKSFFFDSVSNTLTVEDPKLMFFLKNLDWGKLSKECGFTEDDDNEYSYALSFAGEKRIYAEAIKTLLEENEVTVFYDYDHQAKLLGDDVEAYLAPIYASKAKYVIVLLSAEYPAKYWTAFESKQFKDRFGANSVIPVSIDNYNPDPTSAYFGKGRLNISTTEPIEDEVRKVVNVLLRKIDGDE